MIRQARFARAWLASILGLGVVAGLLRAQEDVLPGGSGPSNPQGTSQPIPPEEPVFHRQGVGPPYALPSPQPPARRHPLCECIQRHLLNHPWYCWADHNSVGCGSLNADCTFIFGSCRAFYGEPCFKGPPPPPLPPGYSYGPGGCHCP